MAGLCEEDNIAMTPYSALAILRVGTQSAEVALFEQFQGDSEFWEGLEVKGSCFSLGSMFGMCFISLSKCL